jgi:hypothetical protein
MASKQRLHTLLHISIGGANWKDHKFATTTTTTTTTTHA